MSGTITSLLSVRGGIPRACDIVHRRAAEVGVCIIDAEPIALRPLAKRDVTIDGVGSGCFCIRCRRARMRVWVPGWAPGRRALRRADWAPARVRYHTSARLTAPGLQFADMQVANPAGRGVFDVGKGAQFFA